LRYTVAVSLYRSLGVLKYVETQPVQMKMQLIQKAKKCFIQVFDYKLKYLLRP